MRVARYDLADPSFPVSLVDVEPPPKPGGEWARVQVEASGICGSDLHVVYPTGEGSRIWGPFVSFPLELGHEIAGTVVEAGPDCPVPVGTRVAVDPTVACAARGLPPCARCAVGATSACLQLSSRVLTRGFGHGFTVGLGGGWADELVAHATQLHPVPDGVDAVAAALTEPLSVSIHGLARRPPVDGAPMLVVGAGIIGLTALVAAKALAPSSPVTVLARHPHQAAAGWALGADAVVAADGTELDALAAAAGVPVVGKGDAAILVDGYPVVVEAVGTGASFSFATRACATRGVVHLVGGVGQTSVDLAPVWFKELDVVGTFCHATDRLTSPGPAGEEVEHSFDRALRLLADGALPAEQVVTHRYPLADVRAALEVAHDKASGAIKVVLEP